MKNSILAGLFAMLLFSGCSLVSEQTISPTPATPEKPTMDIVLYTGDPQAVPSTDKSATVTIYKLTLTNPVTDAAVAINGTALTVTATNSGTYIGDLTIGAGAAITVVATVDGTAYTVSKTNFTTYPVITQPTAGATLQATASNNFTWNAAAPATDLIGYYVINNDYNHRLGSVNPITAESFTSSANDPNLQAGAASIHVMAYSRSSFVTGGNTGTFWLFGISQPVSVTVQ